MNKSETMEQKLNFAYGSIQDIQETIRFLDTKAGAIIILITAITTAIIAIMDSFILFFINQTVTCKNILLSGCILFAIFMYITLYLSIKAIHPRNNPNEHVIIGDDKNELILSYFVSGFSSKMRVSDYIKERKDLKSRISVTEHYRAILESTPEQILLTLSYEIIKLSYIRDKKNKRTCCALNCLLLGFLIAFITTILYFIFR